MIGLWSSTFDLDRPKALPGFLQMTSALKGFPIYSSIHRWKRQSEIKRHLVVPTSRVKFCCAIEYPSKLFSFFKILPSPWRIFYLLVPALTFSFINVAIYFYLFTFIKFILFVFVYFYKVLLFE